MSIWQNQVLNGQLKCLNNKDGANGSWLTSDELFLLRKNFNLYLWNNGSVANILSKEWLYKTLQ